MLGNCKFSLLAYYFRADFSFPYSLYSFDIVLVFSIQVSLICISLLASAVQRLVAFVFVFLSIHTTRAVSPCCDPREHPFLAAASSL